MSNQDKNPKNTDSPLFRALTRFLSGPVTRYQRQNPRQLKRWQLDKYKFTSPALLITFILNLYPTLQEGKGM